jgi:hypothetical protein
MTQDFVGKQVNAVVSADAAITCATVRGDRADHAR